MLILLSTPDDYPNEGALLNRMFEANHNLRFHLRKPASDIRECEQLLKSIDSAYHGNIVIHQHHELINDYALKGLHLTAAARTASGLTGVSIISTSFHTLEEAQQEAGNFVYFFCSPVFPSISKAGYSGTENWDISAATDSFRKQAVALGGINSSKSEELKALGFRNQAVLGAVWQSPDPETALPELCRIFEH